MAKKKVQFESFPDGVCKLWQLDGGKRPVLLLSGVRYRERTVGERRNFDAEQAGHTIQMLIRIPQMDFVKPGVFVTIGDQQYKVLQAQKINDTLNISFITTERRSLRPFCARSSAAWAMPSSSWP